MDERRRVQTRVGSLAVRVLGEGPPAVLWHSLFVDDRSWQRVEDELARDRRLVIITGPGHGTSADPGHRYSLDDCAAAAGEVLAALGIEEPVDWVGNAWGGHVGIVFAATRPDRCRTLVTLGTPVQAYTRSEQLLFRVLLAVYRVTGMIGFLSSGIVDALLSPRTRANDPEAVALVLDCLRTMERRALANAMHVDLAGPPGPDPATRRRPLSHRVRHRQRPRGVDGRPGGGEEPAARRWVGRGGPGHGVPDPARGARGDGPDRP